MRRIALCTLAAVAFAAGCGEDSRDPLGSNHPEAASRPSLSAASATGPAVATDKADYAPGETVVITGTGWDAGETVHLMLTEDEAIHEPREWDVTADDAGEFRDESFSPEVHHIGVAFTLKATGLASGKTAQTTFTDGNLTVETNGPSFVLGIAAWGGSRPSNSCSGTPNTTSSATITTAAPFQQGINNNSLRLTASATSAAGGAFLNWTIVTTGDLVAPTTSPAPPVLTDPALCIVGVSGSAKWKVIANYATPPSSTPTTLVVPAATGTYGGQVTLQATLSPALNGRAIAFTLNGNPVGSASTNPSGIATKAAYLSNDGTSGGTLIPAGTYAAGASSGVAASYAGETGPPAYTGSDGANTLTIGQASTTTSITSVSPSGTSVVGQQVVVSFGVDPQFLGTPTGVVEIKNGSTVLCSAPVAAGGCDFTPTSPAALSLKAHYGGDDNFSAGSTASGTSHTVEKAQTGTAITSLSPNPATYGQPVTVSFIVSVTPPGAGTPTGMVQVRDAGDNLVCSGSVATGSCSFTPAAAGAYGLTATYSGDGNFFGSASTPASTLTVNRAPTQTTLSLPGAPYIVNGEIVVTFGVAPLNAAGVYASLPTGKVEVRNGAVVLCSETLPATSCRFTPEAVGAYNLVAYYVGQPNDFDGDANFLAGASASSTIHVRYKFDGLYAPVDRPSILNYSKAGQAVPLKWRLLDANDRPVTTLASVVVKAADMSCALGATTDQLEEYASGSSGLQNLGDGYYQFNWKTPNSYGGSCKTIGLDLGEGAVRSGLAYFTFKK